MLELTNVYNKQVSDICYKTKKGEKSLLLLVKEELAGGRISKDKSKGEIINNKKCFLAIQNAMGDYVSSYPAPASLKKKVRLRFAQWLQAIAAMYGVPEEQIDEACSIVLQHRQGWYPKALASNTPVSSRFRFLILFTYRHVGL